MTVAEEVFVKMKKRMGGVDPYVASKELRRLEDQYGQQSLKTEHVVEEAEYSDSPIHDCFEWDNTVAGHQYRLGQARELIRNIEFVRVRDGKEHDTTPMYLHVKKEDGPCYVRTEVVMESEELKASALGEVLRQLEGLRRRFKHIKKLANVWQAIEDASDNT